MGIILQILPKVVKAAVKAVKAGKKALSASGKPTGMLTKTGYKSRIMLKREATAAKKKGLPPPVQTPPSQWKPKHGVPAGKRKLTGIPTRTSRYSKEEYEAMLKRIGKWDEYLKRKKKK